MGILSKRSLFVASAGAAVLAGPAPAPSPVVTPAAVLPRADWSTLGWYSDATTNGETIYAPWEYDVEETTYSTSSHWFRRCPVTTTCTMYTGCSNGFLMAEGTSSYCGAGGASGSLFCSNHILYTSMGATDAYSWYWCDEAPLTGYTFFAQEPAQPSGLPSSGSASSEASTTASDETSTTSTSRTASSTTGSPAESQTSNPQPEEGSSTNVGAIAGGVVGGVAVLGAIGVAILFLLRRNKKKAAGAAPPQPPMGYQQTLQSPYQQPGYPQSPNAGYGTAYQANEQKPQGVQEVSGYYSQPPQPYPNGPYDPHQSQYYPGPGSPPPPSTSPTPGHVAPQSLPHELPAPQK